jgi:heptosyltransferase-1
MPRRPPLTEISPARIALIKPSSLGDVVHSLPVLHALRVRFPGAHLSWIVNRELAPLLRGHPDLDAVLEFDRRGSWSALARFARELWRRRFDLVIDLQGLLRSGLMAAATRAARRAGLGTAREGAALFYTDVVAISNPESLHSVDRCWRVVEALGAGDVPKRFDVPLDAGAMSWAGGILRGLPRPWLVVAPGARWLTKRWPPEHFAEVLRRAQRAFGGSAILIGAADEARLTRAIAAGLAPRPLDLAGATTLPQLAALLAHADAVLANDSGPLHLAAALGRAVVAPYTCTSPVRHGPYARSGAVASRIWCRGSYLKRCGRMECMTELTPDRLWPDLQEALAWSSRSRSA